MDILGRGYLVTLALFAHIAYNDLVDVSKQLQIIFRTAVFTCPCANYAVSTFAGPCSVSNARLRNTPRLVNCVCHNFASITIQCQRLLGVANVI